MSKNIDGIKRVSATNVAPRPSLQVPSRDSTGGAPARRPETSAPLLGGRSLDGVTVRAVKSQRTGSPMVVPLSTSEASKKPEPDIQTEQVLEVAPEVKYPGKLAGAKRLLGKLNFKHSRYALVALVLGFSMYVLADTLSTNKQLRGTSLVPQQDVVATATSYTNTKESEGADESNVSEDAISQYIVEPTLPRYLFIDKLGLKSRILPMATNRDGSMQAPVNIFDAGWYSRGVSPGQKGAAVINAHASGATREGLFAYIDRLQSGDTIEVERGDGVLLKYRVIETQEVPLDQVDMVELMRVRQGDEGLNLITCSGKWLQRDRTYSHRTIVFTERV